MQNQTITPPKNTQNWKAILSLIMGVVSIIPIMHLLISMGNGLMSALVFVSPIEAFSLSIFSIPGMIFGIMGLKSGRKKLAIVGIIFSVIGFISVIYFLLILWWAMIGGY